MRAGTYTLREDPDGLPRWLVIYSPAVELTGSDPLPKPEHVGYVVKEAPGVWRHWKTNEASVERLFRPAATTQHDAAAHLFPANDFPEKCVRCGENEPTHDAAAYEQPGSHYPYDGILDDHCEDCLEAAQLELNDDYADQRAADVAARRVD